MLLSIDLMALCYYQERMSAKYPQQRRCRYRGFVAILLALALCFTGAVNTAHAAVPTPTVVTAPTDWWSVQWGSGCHYKLLPMAICAVTSRWRCR
ncbi:MAG: hypothetical protein R2932_07255 [Caldilineaceae bacterium]